MRRFAHRVSTQRVSYRVTQGACKGCRFKEQCTPTGQDRTISRFFDQNLVDEAKERLSSPRGQELLLQRRISVEGVFAWAKELHGLRRTRFMGRWKVQIQLWLTAAVINIKRAVKQLARTEPARSQEVTNRAFITGMLADAAKKIAIVLHCIFCRLPEYFGNSTTIVATSLSIFAALLFNLLLLTYDAIRKTNDTGSSDTLRRDFLRELFSNISFAIFVAIVAIVFVLVLVLLDKATVAQHVFSFFVYYLVSVFVLTLLMVLKRMHVLLAKEFDTD